MEIIIAILVAINLFYIINMLINHSVSGDMFDECLITKKLFYIIELISLVIIIISVISISNKTISTTIIKSNQFNEENIKVSFNKVVSITKYVDKYKFFIGSYNTTYYVEY